jgi:anti-anti-sigma factor
MVHITNQDDVAVFQVRGDYGSLDTEPIGSIDSALSRHVDTAERPRVVLDLSRTRYFGVDFMNVLTQISAKVSQRQGRMALCGLTPFCAEVLHAVRLDERLTNHSSCDEAVAAVAGA